MNNSFSAKSQSHVTFPESPITHVFNTDRKEIFSDDDVPYQKYYKKPDQKKNEKFKEEKRDAINKIQQDIQAIEQKISSLYL